MCAYMMNKTNPCSRFVQHNAKQICLPLLKFVKLAKQLALSTEGPCKRTQQVPTTPNIVGVVSQQCCVRLHGPKSLTGFKLYATSANNSQHCLGSMQTDTTSYNIVGTNNVGCCWPTMLGSFAWP